MIDVSRFPIPPEQCTLATCSLDEAQVDYVPSLGGNAAFLAIFAVILIGHVIQGIRYRTWGVLVGMFVGLVLEVAGYSFRIQMHSNPFKSGSFINQLIFLTLAPAFLSASIYLCLARIVIVEGQDYSRLKPRTYSLLFIGCDFLSLMLQSTGGAIAAITKTKKLADTGVHIMISGLAFQIFSLILFLSLWFEFDWSKRKAGNLGEKSDLGQQQADLTSLRTTRTFRAFKCALWISAICIFIRSIYRLIELQGGFSSKIANNELAFMILEAPMIIVATGVLVVVHPGVGFAGKWAMADYGFWEKKDSHTVETNRVTV